MAVKFEFYLSDKDIDRLFYLKNGIEKKNDLTGNEFAKELLEELLYSKVPRVPEMDDCGNYTE